MSTVKEHYDNHLGNFYSWMLGDFETKCKEQEEFFIRNDVRPESSKVALDLGCGNGIQSVSLARLGFEVRAIDFNKQLLDELQSRKGDLNIEVIHADLLNESNFTSYHPELIVCMGDTLTHLPDKESVIKLISLAGDALPQNGKLIFSFRDLNHELKQEQRFIPVRSDENRIHTCFLEYFESHVVVHDILHERVSGTGHMKASAYPKLKISSAELRKILKEEGFTVGREELINRMIYMIMEKL